MRRRSNLLPASRNKTDAAKSAIRIRVKMLKTFQHPTGCAILKSTACFRLIFYIAFSILTAGHRVISFSAMTSPNGAQALPRCSEIRTAPSAGAPPDSPQGNGIDLRQRGVAVGDDHRPAPAALLRMNLRNTVEVRSVGRLYVAAQHGASIVISDTALLN